MFLKDNIVPKSLNDFVINKKAANDIQQLFCKEFLSNLYIFGPPGSGKYTLFLKCLEMIVGTKIETVLKTLNINNQWASIKEYSILVSEFHFEINLSKYSNNKNNLFSIIDTITESKEINNNLDFKIILIRNIHNISNDFVKFIKKKAEQLSDSIRFVLIGNTNSVNISTLNGTFFFLRVEAPSNTEIMQLVTHTLKQLKKYSKIDKKKLNELLNKSSPNLNIILTKLEMVILGNFYKTRLEITTEKICKLLLDKKLSTLYDIRELIYDYQTHNENMQSLLKNILYEFLDGNYLCDDKKSQLINIVQQIDINYNLSYKEIIHIEQGMFKIFKLFHVNP